MANMKLKATKYSINKVNDVGAVLAEFFVVKIYLYRYWNENYGWNVDLHQGYWGSGQWYFWQRVGYNWNKKILLWKLRRVGVSGTYRSKIEVYTSASYGRNVFDWVINFCEKKMKLPMPLVLGNWISYDISYRPLIQQNQGSTHKLLIFLVIKHRKYNIIT